MNEAAKPAAAPTRLKPIVTLDIKFFWDACDKGELVVERCSACQKVRFPPRPMCPHCHSTKREHVKVSGRGKVYSWIRPVHPKPVGFDAPPIVALVELEEGFRLVSNRYGVEFDQIKRDLPVELFVDKTVGGRQVPVFKPRAA